MINHLAIKCIATMGILALVVAAILILATKDMDVIKLVVPTVIGLTGTAIAGLVGHLNTGKPEQLPKPEGTMEAK
jgi:hypothetical protein